MSKPPNCYGEVLWLFWSKPNQCSPHHHVHIALGPTRQTARPKPLPGEHKSFTAALLSTQKSKRRWFCLAENDSREKIILLLGSAESLEVSAKSTAMWMRQEITGIFNGQECAWTGSPAAGCMHAAESGDWNSFLSTSWILSEHYLPKRLILRDSAVAIGDLRYSLHLCLYCRRPLQFWTVINREK